MTSVPVATLYVSCPRAALPTCSRPAPSWRRPRSPSWSPRRAARSSSPTRRLTGFERGELLGNRWRGCSQPISPSTPRARRSRPCALGEMVITCPWRCTSAGHAATPLLVVTLRDLTELEAGRAARFEAEADPVDESSESIYVSPQVVELLGISQDDWAERPVRVAAPRAPRGHRPRLGGVPVCVQRARATQPRVPDGP
jgi:hypothetical protein